MRTPNRNKTLNRFYLSKLLFRHDSRVTNTALNIFPHPVGFGSNKKAEQHLKKALEINPDGVDSNYFYGDYLIDRKRYDEAIVALNKAKASPDRPDQPLADQGRRAEIDKAIAMTKSKI